MWVLTTRGFYAVASYDEDKAKPEVRELADIAADGNAPLVIVRTRCEDDMRALFEVFGVTGWWINDPNADYEWRTVLTKKDWETALGLMIDEIDYTSYKKAVLAKDPPRYHVLVDVWTALLSLGIKPRPRTVSAFYERYIRSEPHDHDRVDN